LNGPKLNVYDANGDGIPAGGGKLIRKFDAGLFGAFVQVAPNGQFALVGISGSTPSDSKVLKVDLTTDVVDDFITNIPFVFDLTFVNDSFAYLSANPDSIAFDRNDLFRVELTTPPTVKLVAQISGTFSAPIAANTGGDLYYAKGSSALDPVTFLPAPNSGRLLKFGATPLSEAIAKGPLNENDSSIDISLDVAYDIVFHQFRNGPRELFISTTSNQLLRFSEQTLSVEKNFVSITDPAGPVFLTGLAFFNSDGRFDSAAASDSKLGISTSISFTDFALTEITSTTFDEDLDGAFGSADLCPADAAKVDPGQCGCGRQDVDSNSDGIVDCGTPRSFAKSLKPVFASLNVAPDEIVAGLEKLTTRRFQYEVTLKGPGNNGKIRTILTRNGQVRFRRLKKGTYVLSYRIRKTVGGKVRKSKRSERQIVVVN
jgi:hypothetical protein